MCNDSNGEKSNCSSKKMRRNIAYLFNYDFKDKFDGRLVYKSMQEFLDENQKEKNNLNNLLNVLYDANKNPTMLGEVLKAHKDEIKELFNYYFKIMLLQLESVDKESKVIDLLLRLDKEVLPDINNIEYLILIISQYITGKQRRQIMLEIPEFSFLMQLSNKLANVPMDDKVSKIYNYFDNYQVLEVLKFNLEYMDQLTNEELDRNFNLAIKTSYHLAMFNGYKNKITMARKNGLNFEFTAKLSKVTKDIFLKGLEQYSKMEERVRLKDSDILVLVRNCFARYLGEEYAAIYDEAFNKRRVVLIHSKNEVPHVSNAKENNLVFIKKLEDFSSALALSHEMGHYVDYVLTDSNQIILSEPSDLLVEVPSMLNEILFMDYMFNYLDRGTLGSKKIEEYLRQNIKLFSFVSFANAVHYQYHTLLFEKLLIEKNTKFDFTKEDFDKIWKEEIVDKINKEILKYLIPEFSYSNLAQLVFQNAKYIYGFVIALEIFKKIKKDSLYVKVYMNYLKKNQSMNFKEKLAFLQIDLSYDEWIKDVVDFLENLLNI